MTRGRAPQESRVLIVEDDAILAIDLTMTVEEAGHRVTGPFHRLQPAMECCLAGVDVALLDVDVGGAEVFPVADRCVDADVAVVFHTGRDSTSAMRDRYPMAEILGKPSSPRLIAKAVARATALRCDRRIA
jgi:DNA-binding NtrC family response regulator